MNIKREMLKYYKNYNKLIYKINIMDVYIIVDKLSINTKNFKIGEEILFNYKTYEMCFYENIEDVEEKFYITQINKNTLFKCLKLKRKHIIDKLLKNEF